MPFSLLNRTAARGRESGVSVSPDTSFEEVLAGRREDPHCEKFTQTSFTKTLS